MTASSQLLEFLRAGACGEEAGSWDAARAASAAAGCAEAFRQIVERHGPGLHRFCLHALGCVSDAEDVCQETFVRAWHALPRYREQGHFRAWLWQIALNLCRDHARTRTARRRWLCDWPADLPPEALAPAAQSPDEAAALRADLVRLGTGLALLPERLRTPLVLCAVENLPQAEVAAILRLSVRAVETRVLRARRRLADWWERQEVR